MKWTACYIVLNGEEYIWYSIKSIQKFIKDSGGKIIIIEGSTKYANLVAEDGNSIDNTKYIIENIVKEDPDLFIYKRVGRVNNKAILRNVYLNVIKTSPKEEQPDWLLVVDDDELYKEEDLKQLDKYLSRAENIVHVFNPQYWFWKDFNHICTIDEQLVREEIKSGKRRDKLFYDAFGNAIRQGQYHERIFKWNQGLHYINHPTVADSMNRDLYIHPYYQTKRIIYNECPRYHYGYLKKKANMLEKFKYYAERDNNINKAEQERIYMIVNTDPYMLYLKGDAIVDKETNETGIQKFKRTKPSYNIVEFDNTHPEIIKQHPYFKENFILTL